MGDVKVNNRFEDLIPFCVFPNSFIRNGKIPTQQRVLFEILCTYDFVDKNGKRKGWCDPGLETLSDQLGLSVRSTQVHLKRLVESGLVTVVYRNNCMVGKRNSIYVLNILPGLSATDRKRIAATRNVNIKHLLSGLNTIKIQTTSGIHNIAYKEFDLRFLITGEHEEEVIEGEVASADEIISAEEESKIPKKELTESIEPVNPDKEIKNEDDIVISFKKSDIPINIRAKSKITSSDNPNWDSTDTVTRILCGNYQNLKLLDYCKYFKHKFELTYPGELYIIDRMKDTRAIKLKLVDFEPEMLLKLLDYFVQNYQRLFYSNDYRRPKLFQISIAWLSNKLLENFYFAEKGKQEQESIPIQKDNVEFQLF